MIQPFWAISLVEDAAAETTTLSIRTDTLTASAVEQLAYEIQQAVKRFNDNRAAGLVT
jgi:hypothetical protein